MSASKDRQGISIRSMKKGERCIQSRIEKGRDEWQEGSSV